MLSKTRGIVLRTMPYNDKSSIIYMYTENFGRRSYLVRWSQRKGGLFSKALFMPFSVLDLEVIHWPKRELHQIKECRIDFPTNRIATDPVRSALAQFLAEVLFRGVQDTEPDQRLFDYLLHSIHLLETSDEGIPNFHLVFLLGLPHYLGIFPNLESYQEDSYFDLREGVFTSIEPSHPFYLNRQESAFFHKLLRISYENMVLYAFSRKERVRILQHIMSYYRLHLPNFSEIKSLEVLQAFFD